MKMGGFETIRARVKAPSSETARILSNALENVQREDLSTYEKARVCSTLREKKLSLKETMEATGWSQSYISNLTVCFNSLHPEILADWQGNNDNDEDKKGPAVVSYLRELAKEKDKEKQLDVWKAHKASFSAAMEDLYDESDEDDEDDEDDKDGSKSKPKNYTVKRERYNALIRALKANKSPAIALHAVQYLIGKFDRIKGLPGLGPDDTKKTTTDDKE
jgi:ParB-like chromosome segregation protein Spo0J